MLGFVLALACTLRAYGGQSPPKEISAQEQIASLLLVTNPVLRPKSSPVRTHSTEMGYVKPIDIFPGAPETENYGPKGEVLSRTIQPPKGYTAYGYKGQGFFGIGSVSDKYGGRNVKLLAKVEELGLLSFLADNNLLSKAEESGLFSSLEAAGALSAAEKFLPTAERLGLLSLAQGLINEPPTLTFLIGGVLAGLAPLYALWDVLGVFPDPNLPGGLALATTTVTGLALCAYAQAIFTLQKGQGPSTDGGKDVQLLAAVERLRLLSFLADQGLLSSLEEAGVLSSLEEAGAFSTIEKQLPTIEKLGLLSAAEKAIDRDPSALETSGAVLAAAAPIYAALDAAGQVPHPGVLPLALGGLTTTAAGVALLVAANAIKSIQAVGVPEADKLPEYFGAEARAR